MSFTQSPASPLVNGGVDTPVDSPVASTMGGAWGGSEYVGGGLFTDMLDGGKNLYKSMIVKEETITILCVVRGVISALTLLFIILLMAYATGTLSLTSSNAMGIGGTAIALLILSFVIDLSLVLKPEWLEHKPALETK